jgi:hypothetical protein
VSEKGDSPREIQNKSISSQDEYDNNNATAYSTPKKQRYRACVRYGLPQATFWTSQTNAQLGLQKNNAAGDAPYIS